MTLPEAARKALKRLGRPARVAEIMDSILADNSKGAWRPAGSTPSASLRSDLGNAIQKKGASRIFAKTARGLYGLREWQLSYLDAAEKVLYVHSEGCPMTYAAITRRASELGILKMAGGHPADTPAETMRSRLTHDITTRSNGSSTPRFTREAGRGAPFGLAKWTAKLSQAEVELQNRLVKEQLLLRLKQLHFAQFEAEVKRWLEGFGFLMDEMDKVGGSHDGGIDLKGTRTTDGFMTTKIAVQVKKWENDVRSPDVQRLRGALSVDDKGLLVNTGDFTPGARSEAIRPGAVPIDLLGGKMLCDLLVAQGRGMLRLPNGLLYLVHTGG